MASAKRRKKSSKGGARSPQQKGAETRRLNRKRREREEKARAKKARAAARKGAATKRRKKREAEETHRRRVEAGQRGYRKKLAKTRARDALETWLDNAGQRDARGTFVRETRVLHEQWLRSKRALFDEVGDDYDDYLGILEELAEEVGTEWDIAYGPDAEAS